MDKHQERAVFPVSGQSCDQHCQKQQLRIRTFPNAMAETSGPGTRSAVGFLFSLSLKIGDSKMTAIAKDERTSATAVAVFYLKSPKTVTKAVKDALKQPELEVRNITCPANSNIMTVELVFHEKEILLSFGNSFQWEKVKRKLETKLNTVGFRGKLHVTIDNEEEVRKKMDEIR